MNSLFDDSETLTAKTAELVWNIENVQRMLTDIKDCQSVSETMIECLHQKIDYIQSACRTIEKLKGNE